VDKGTMKKIIDDVVKKRKKTMKENIAMKKKKTSRRHSCGIGQMAGALRIDDVASMPTAAVGIGGGRCASDR